MLLRALIGGLAAAAAAQLLWLVLFDSCAAWWHRPTPDATKGARVLVTGSSRGVGAAVAGLYCRLGASVALHASGSGSASGSALQAVAAECRRSGAADVTIVAGDMSAVGVAASVVDKAAAVLGGLDIVVVNHVSQFVFETQSSMTQRLVDGSLQRAMQIDLYSYTEAAAAALLHLEASGGSIVFVTSLAAELPMQYCYGYCFAKRALAGHVTSLRQELAINGSRVHVALAQLGLIDTQSARQLIGSLMPQRPVPYASLEETAIGIGSMAAGRIRDLVIPGRLKPALVLKWLAPEFVANGFRSLFAAKR